MKKFNILKFLILVTIVLLSTKNTFASTSVVQTLSVSAQPTVAITKTSNSIETGEINPETGNHSGLNVSFNLQTNGTDDDYIFIVGSKITSYGNQEVSAYTADGKGLLFARNDSEEHFPSQQAIENAIKGSVRQSYEYSEEITVREAAEQYINLMNSNMIGTTGYRPQGHPKTDVILGYINYNLEYEGD